MGFFDRFKKRTSDADDDEDEWEDDWTDVPAAAIAVIREGFNVPTDDDMRALLRRHAPASAELPCTGMAQMRWFQKEEWVQSGVMGAARALVRVYGIDPAKTTWQVVTDDRGARAAVVFLRR